MLLAPSANRVYAQATAQLAAAELSLLLPQVQDVRPSSLAGVGAVEFSTEQLDLSALAKISTRLVAFRRVADLLEPLNVETAQFFPDDLVTIPKYQGKTNEMFTRLLANLTLHQVRSSSAQLDILDPMAGRGTTLLTAWQLGHNGFGVEAEQRSVEALEAYLKTYLRRGRYKHDATNSPVRREGKSVGRRLDVNVRLPERALTMSVFTGDTTDAAKLFGKKRFDAIITDAPYGVVHGSQRKPGGAASTSHPDRQRSPEQLLRAAIPIWASQLKPGGALGLAWNTYGLTREDLVDIVTDAGLTAQNSGPWLEFAHRVDSSINRDLLVAVNRLGA